MKRAAFLLLLLAAAATSACGAKHGDDDDGGKGKVSTKFHYTQPPAPWKPTKVDGTQVAYYHADFGATMSVATECKDVEDVSLPSLVQQELIGIPHRKVVSQTQTTVGERAGEDWVVDGQLDGVDVRCELIVLRESKCVYDLNLVAKPASFDAAQKDFKTFLGGFSVAK